MKLRNKKTGEIVEFFNNTCGIFPDSLAELCEEWEDCEEPKEFWYIYAGKPQRADCGDILEEDFRAIGNHFETREETEKTIEKLKALKRLKEKGFRFERWKKSCNTDGKIIFHLDELGPRLANFRDDLNLLFGSEE